MERDDADDFFKIAESEVRSQSTRHGNIGIHRSESVTSRDAFVERDHNTDESKSLDMRSDLDSFDLDVVDINNNFEENQASNSHEDS